MDQYQQHAFPRDIVIEALNGGDLDAAALLAVRGQCIAEAHLFAADLTAYRLMELSADPAATIVAAKKGGKIVGLAIAVDGGLTAVADKSVPLQFLEPLLQRMQVEIVDLQQLWRGI